MREGDATDSAESQMIETETLKSVRFSIPEEPATAQPERVWPHQRLARRVAQILRPRVSDAAERGNLVSDILSELWQWSNRTPQPLNEEQLQGVSARLAYRAFNAYEKERRITNQQEQNLVKDTAEARLTPGNTGYEVASLLCDLWHGVCKLPLRQRAPLLLQSDEFLEQLLAAGIPAAEIAAAIGVDEAVLRELGPRLPLTDDDLMQFYQATRHAIKNRNELKQLRKRGRATLAAWLARR